MEKLKQLINEVGIAEIENQLAILKSNNDNELEQFINSCFTDLVVSKKYCYSDDVSFIKGNDEVYFIYNSKDK